MKTIKNSKEITTLEVGDRIMFGDLAYIVTQSAYCGSYYLILTTDDNDKIFKVLNINKRDFVRNLGIDTLPVNWSFPETHSLEALTAIVSALFKEYEKQNELPKTWEEFCEKNSFQSEECYISPCCNIIYTGRVGRSRDKNEDRSCCTSEREAQAFLALMQLRQLRKCYVGDWEPDWMSDTESKYCVNLQANNFSIQRWRHINNPFSFPTETLAIQFLNNFKDLLEIAKPLL